MIILNRQLNSHIVNNCSSEKDVTEIETLLGDEKRGQEYSTKSSTGKEIEQSKTYMSFTPIKIAETLSYQNVLRMTIPLIYIISIFWNSSSAYCIFIVTAIHLVSEYRNSIGQIKHTKDHTVRKDEHKQEDSYINSRESSVYDCRIKIQSILGEIQAPLLTPISPLDTTCASLDHDILLYFAKTESDLFQSLDTAIYNLRILIALNVGLGPYSPSIERVQDSKMLTDSIRMKANAHASKKILFQCMHMQFLSLANFFRNDFFQHSIHHGAIENYHKHYEHVAESQVLTISILKKCRRCNSEILSAVLSYIFKCNSEKNINELFQANILQSKELRTYIKSYFDLEGICDSDSTNTTVNRLVYIQKHLHAAQVAIWSYSKSLQSLVSSQEEQEKRDEEEATLFQNITTLFHQASSAFIHLSNVLYPEKGSINTNGNENEVTCGHIIRPLDSTSYDDNGVDDITPCYQDGINHSKQCKTVVFSGKGQKSNKILRSTNVDDLKSNSNVFSGYANERIHLLTELQARLTLMDFGEEINADSSEESDIEHEQTVKDNKAEGSCSKKYSTQNIGFVRNDLMLELKGKICTDNDTAILE
jgi:hypothetical protein